MANIIHHLKNGEFQKVLNFCQQELARTPDDYNLIIVKGWCLYELGNIPKANTCMLRWKDADDMHIFSIELAQDYFFLQEDHQQVIDLAKTFIKKYPRESRLHYRLGLSSGIVGDESQAIDSFRKTIALKYDPKTATNLACILLNRHEYEEGFVLYEARFKAFPHCNWFLDKAKSLPYWQGESLHHKTILLWSEQGIGDTLQFCRFVSILAKQCAGVHLLLHGTHTGLKRILLTLDGVQAIHTIHGGEPICLPEVDYHCPMMSVMKHLGMNQHTIPSNTPYLTCTTAHHERWQYLKKVRTLNIGLVWKTQTRIDSQEKRRGLGKGIHAKNMQLKELEPLLAVSGLQFFSLQYVVDNSDKPLMEKWHIMDTSVHIHDFEDTAAIISHMDIVVSIDTAVTHLAGALAKPVINMLPYVNDWRWQEDRTDSPWYPTMTLVRQKKRGVWQSVVQEVVKKIQQTLSVNVHKNGVKQLIKSGNYLPALSLQEQIVNTLTVQNTLSSDDVDMLCYLHFSRKNYRSAYDAIERYSERLLATGRLCWNKVTLLYLQGRYSEAREKGLEALALFPDFEGGKSILARICGALNLRHEAKQYGEASMLSNDSLSLKKGGQVFSIPSTPAVFHPDNTERNIIAYSLWGDNRRYLDNAIENARIKDHFFPEWTLRFYVEEGIQQSIIDNLRSYGVQVVVRKKQKLLFEGLFWRFLVINDPSVDYFLIRDADSLFTQKEVAAVREWLLSGKCFHIMRDHYEQTDLIQAGLWGGVGKILPSVNTLLSQFKPAAPSKMVDQEFLSVFVWPTVKQSVLIHDSFYRVFDAKPFPLTGDAAVALGKYNE